MGWVVCNATVSRSGEIETREKKRKGKGKEEPISPVLRQSPSSSAHFSHSPRARDRWGPRDSPPIDNSDRKRLERIHIETRDGPPLRLSKLLPPPARGTAESFSFPPSAFGSSDFSTFFNTRFLPPCAPWQPPPTRSHLRTSSEVDSLFSYYPH